MMVTIWYLQTLDPSELRPRGFPEAPVQVLECTVKEWRYNRFLYRLVGEPWQWTGKLEWSRAQWEAYVQSERLRTWVGYWDGSPAGYYELHRADDDSVQIAYFGLVAAFIGQRLGGALLTHAIRTAWAWGTSRVWVHTCSLDHPSALANYRARGMRIYRQLEADPVRPPPRGPMGASL